MPIKAVIKFLNGNECEGILTHPLNPEEAGIELLDGKTSQPATYPFEAICFIRLHDDPSLHPELAKDSAPEDIYTATGDSFRLLLNRGERYFRGVFGYSENPAQTGFTRIFFTRIGLDIKKLNPLLGEVLTKQGAIKEDKLKRGLELQDKLRKQRLGEILTEEGHLRQTSGEAVIAAAKKSGHRATQYRVGDILIEAGLVTRRQVDEARAKQENNRHKKLGSILVEKGWISEDQLLEALAQKFGLRVIDLDEAQVSPEAVRTISRGLIERMQVLPIEVTSNRLVVATSTPTDPTISDNLCFATNRRIELVVASARKIEEHIQRFFYDSEDEIEELIGNLDDVKIEVVEEKEVERVTESDSKVITLVNKILLDAHRRGVSDIHFEPEMGTSPLIVRYRKDGQCYTAHRIGAQYKKAIISRIKIISKLDIAERRRPQSGKIMLKHGREKIEYRVEITPTIGGQEDAVLRVLNAARILSLEQLGVSAHHNERFQALLKKPYGIILCVGPTGSGKTTTLHSAISEINTGNRKIWTAEDPVEITQRGLRQVQVNAKIGFTFEEALRSFLRADPDVIMIGEMRDRVTAKAAIAASLTGHLVFSTLHTNNAPETIVRLIEMGEDPVNFSEAMLGIIAQRLVRRLCNQCKVPYHPSQEEYEQLVASYGEEYFSAHNMPALTDDLMLMRSQGCPTCEGFGYSGRIAIQELLVNSPALKQAIRQRAGAGVLEEVARQEGMRTLRQDGIEKIFQGITDLSQVNMVCL
ncbi:GspE/PulE family protein [Desulfuromonas sp. AOP6]|uniref:GspE/PulE family protein n=1 Tax=Desulfuromonas sp. AOP6 TaxID=1566351 RepID=UPI00127D1636|nr:GspE/PulE family protein [Desulfuromonas sp. AOP6]BCA78770.1 general secretory pathway protein GspE [Desulfuromonas sp. AOP6]